MMYKRDLAPGQNPHINYEPSMLNGLKEATQTAKEYTPHIEGKLVRESIDRQSNTKQAGETYRNFEQWERDELLKNLIRDLSVCNMAIQKAMIALAEEADKEYGRLLKEGLQKAEKTHLHQSLSAILMVTMLLRMQLIMDMMQSHTKNNKVALYIRD